MNSELTTFGQCVLTVSHKVSASDVSVESYVSTENMVSDCGGIQTASSLPVGATKLNSFLPGDTLFSNIRTYFRKVWPANFAGAASPDVLVFRSKDRVKLAEDFLYYLVSNPDFIAYTDRTSKGVKMPRGDKDAINRYEFSLPSLAEQVKVSSILKSLDDRIFLLRETNATVESIALAIFKSWFVDFDPIHFKRKGLVPVGMNEAVANLFPDSFEQSDLGALPSGWRVGKLSDLAQLNPESWTDKCHPESVAYVDLANVKDNQIAAMTSYDFYDAPSRARRVLRSGDTIVGTVRPGNRSFAFIDQPQVNLTASTGFAVLRPLEKVNAEFVFLSATSESSIEHLAHIADGGAYPAVRPDAVIGLSCVLPCDEILLLFHQIARPLLSKVSENQKMIKTLSNYRDTLLPRLISGQLQIPEDEALV